jgi:hypothetical protein
MVSRSIVSEGILQDSYKQDMAKPAMIERMLFPNRTKKSSGITENTSGSANKKVLETMLQFCTRLH